MSTEAPDTASESDPTSHDGQGLWSRATARFLPSTEDGPDIDQILAEASPVHWSETTRLLVGLAAMFAGFALFGQLTELVVPIIMTILLVLITRPVIHLLHERTSWKWSVCVIAAYSVIGLILVVGVFLLGAELVDQARGLAASLSTSAESPDTVAPPGVSPEVLSTIAGLLLKVGGALLATTLSLLGWSFFVVGAAFFTLLESPPGRGRTRLQIQQFTPDLTQIGAELRRIWGQWIYGQVILSGLTFTSYFLLLTVLGVDNRLAISAISVVGRFIPYIGATITWAVLFLTALGQGTNPFGMTQVAYASLAVILAIIIDQTFDQFLVPKLFGTLLKLPTVAVMVGTVAMGLLMGFFGIFVAAPLMASVRVFVTWLSLRVFDDEPAGQSP